MISLLFFIVLSLIVVIVHSEPSIKIDVKGILQKKQKVTIEWKDIEKPEYVDIISIYGCKREDCQNIDPVNDRLFVPIPVSESPTWYEGYGSIDVEIRNIHINFVVQYLQNVESTYTDDASSTCGTKLQEVTVAATSNIVVIDPVYPLQGHIALAHPKGYDIRVQFTLLKKRSDAFVIYGEESGKLNQKVAVSDVTTYHASEMDPPASTIEGLQHWHPIGFLYDVVLPGLNPETRYYYRFGVAESMSEEFSFKTKPEDGSTRPRSFLAFGDLGVGSPQGDSANWIQEQIVQDVNSTKYDFIIHFGDISYARSSSLDWNLYMTQIEDFAANIPYFVSEGNHEYCYIGQPFRPTWANYGTDSDGEKSVPFLNRFHMPHSDKMERNLWYSFNWGLVHHVVYTGERDFLPGSPQREWLEADLSSVNRTITPWVIVETHRPIYQSGYDVGDRGFTGPYHDIMEPLILKHKVDIVLAGHLHFQERTCQIRNYECIGEKGVYDGSAPVHITIGSTCCEEAFDYPQPEWSLYRSQVKAYGRVHVISDKIITVETIEAKTGIVADTMTIKKA